MFTLQLPGTISDTSLPNPTLADPLLNGANGGIKALFDLAASQSWAKQAAPANGDSVADLGGGSALTAVTAGGTPLTFAGGGFDFTGITAAGNNVKAAAVLSSIKAAANQYFSVCMYFKLPATWNSSASLRPFFCATSGSGGYAAPEVDLVTVAQVNGQQLTARRQTNGAGTVDNLTVAVPNGYLGLVAQIAFWRNASGETLRVKSSAGTLTASAAVGSNNTGDFSAQQPRWGVPTSFNTSAGFTSAATSERLYRGWISDLSVDTRDPAAVLDADYAAAVSRFS